MQKMSWWVAFDIYIKKRLGWLWVLLSLIWGVSVSGPGGAFFGVFLVISVGCFLTRFLFVICRSSYGAGQCGELVSRGDNFCRKCREEVPDNLKNIHGGNKDLPKTPDRIRGFYLS